MLQTGTARMGGKGDPLGIVQETKIYPCWKMGYAQTRLFSRKWET